MVDADSAFQERQYIFDLCTSRFYVGLNLFKR